MIRRLHGKDGGGDGSGGGGKDGAKDQQQVPVSV